MPTLKEAFSGFFFFLSRLVVVVDLLLLPTTHVSGLGTLVLIVKCQSMLQCVTEKKKERT